MVEKMLKEKPRGAGRSVDSGAEGTKKRREKGRLAQRVFRQKQIDTIRILKDENQKFRDAIAAISAAATGDQVILNRAIKDARRIAGTNDSSDNANNDHADSHQTTDLVPKPSFAGALSEMPGYGYRHDATIDQTYHWSPQPNFQISDLLSAPANDMHLRITAAPAEIVPYLGTEAYTVAGQIHWIAMAYGYSAAKALREATPSVHLNKYASEAFAKTMQYASIDDVLSVLRGRLMYRKHGFMAGDDHGGYDPWTARAIMMIIVDRCAPVERHLLFTAFDVAERLRNELGASRFAKLEAALAGQASISWIAVTRSFTRELAFHAICYGEGPRWRAEHIVAAARRWILGTSLLTQ